MSQQLKGALYRALKELNAPFSKDYRNYTVAELQEAYDAYVAAGAAQPLEFKEPEPQQPAAPPRAPQPTAPIAPKDPNEFAGQRLNTNAELEPIRTDPETGFIWYQEEVAKPAFPKPRGRRVLDYTETGVETKTVQNGNYMETFEVAGQQQARAAQVKITLPSYQVGIYKDPRFPFKIHTYNGNQGFDLFDVEKYYGGRDLVPSEVKRKYVSNDLCYDIRSVVAAIQSEYRRLQLQGKA